MRTRYKIKSLILGVSFVLSGCYVHYPSIGVPGKRIKPTNMYGEVLQRCCYVAIDIDTNMKVYDCVDMYPSQCAKILDK